MDQMKKNILANIVRVALLSGSIALGGCGSPTPQTTRTQTVYKYTGCCCDWSSIAEEVRLASVGIESTNDKICSSGSGVIISHDGYIVTNNHVIEGAKSIRVRVRVRVSGGPDYSIRYFNAKREALYNEGKGDLALLKINANGLHFLDFGRSDEIKVGEPILTVGNPHGRRGVITSGIVSDKGAKYSEEYGYKGYNGPFIQHTAALNPGSSGGALVNHEGELIGINTFINTSSEDWSGQSFSIPIKFVKEKLLNPYFYPES